MDYSKTITLGNYKNQFIVITKLDVMLIGERRFEKRL
jgi:hypothetical protein